LQRIRNRGTIETSPSGHDEFVIQPQVRFIECPIKTAQGVLGKKWTILIIRDIGLNKIRRFNRFLDSIPGITPRVLSMRLKELEKEGYIRCEEKKKSPMMVSWRLTEKGRDVIPILLQMVAFSSKWHSDVIFEDKMPRKINEIFSQSEAKEIMKGYF
jgi:DNA-binding HxlR family transcriptional regulator